VTSLYRGPNPTSEVGVKTCGDFFSYPRHKLLGSLTRNNEVLVGVTTGPEAPY
jgi:hypothetical protein